SASFVGAPRGRGSEAPQRPQRMSASSFSFPQFRQFTACSRGADRSPGHASVPQEPMALRSFGTLAIFWLGSLAAAAACASEKSTPRGDAGGGAPGGSGGTNAGSGGSVTGGTSGGGSGGGGGSGASGGMALRRGDVLEFVPGPGEVPYAIGENPYGIHGGAFLARSALGNTIAIADEPGKICISGNLEEVPDANYSQ